MSREVNILKTRGLYNLHSLENMPGTCVCVPKISTGKTNGRDRIVDWHVPSGSVFSHLFLSGKCTSSLAIKKSLWKYYEESIYGFQFFLHQNKVVLICYNRHENIYIVWGTKNNLRHQSEKSIKTTNWSKNIKFMVKFGWKNGDINDFFPQSLWRQCSQRNHQSSNR